MSALRRDRAGKGTARKLRGEGRVPAVIYGAKEPPVMISIERRTFERVLRGKGFFSHILPLDIEGQVEKVLARDVQFHPVTDVPIHADFLRVSDQTPIIVSVSCQFINHAESPGLKRGGVLNIVRHDIELSCRAGAIPEVIVIDLAGTEIGDSIHFSRIQLPEGVRPTITDRDFTIASVAAPSGLKSEQEGAAS